MVTNKETQRTQRIAELKREGNIKSSFSLSSLCSPCLCGEIFYSAMTQKRRYDNEIWGEKRCFETTLGESF